MNALAICSAIAGLSTDLLCAHALQLPGTFFNPVAGNNDRFLVDVLEHIRFPENSRSLRERFAHCMKIDEDDAVLFIAADIMDDVLSRFIECVCNSQQRCKALDDQLIENSQPGKPGELQLSIRMAVKKCGIGDEELVLGRY